MFLCLEAFLESHSESEGSMEGGPQECRVPECPSGSSRFSNV